MNAAECKTLRERLGLTAKAFGLLLPRQVRERTVRYWESGVQPVPVDAAALLLDLDARMAHRAEAALAAACNDCARAHVHLVRYAEAVDLDPDLRLFGIGFHAALLGRTRELLVRKGASVRIVGYDKPACRAWLRRNGLRDDAAGRAAWASSL